MKYWTIHYPGDNDEHCSETLSDDEIIAQYFPYWWGKIIEKFGKEYAEEHFSKQDCINDWITIHWAVEFLPDQ